MSCSQLERHFVLQLHLEESGSPTVLSLATFVPFASSHRACVPFMHSCGAFDIDRATNLELGEDRLGFLGSSKRESAQTPSPRWESGPCWWDRLASMPARSPKDGAFIERLFWGARWAVYVHIFNELLRNHGKLLASPCSRWTYWNRSLLSYLLMINILTGHLSLWVILCYGAFLFLWGRELDAKKVGAHWHRTMKLFLGSYYSLATYCLNAGTSFHLFNPKHVKGKKSQLSH